MMNKQEWLQKRRNSIGSSDAPIIMGVSPYKTLYQLWEEKILGTHQEQTSSMKRGLDLEPFVLNELYKKLGIKFETQHMLFHENYSWMTATYDGINFDRNVGCEIKCGSRENHELTKKGRIPEKYIPQVQHQNEVKKFDRFFYASFFDGQIEIIETGKDEKYIYELIKKEEEFYKSIINLEPPELTDKDFIDRDNKWFFTASHVFSLQEQIKSLELEEKKAKKELIALSENKNSKANNLKFTKSIQQGPLDYKSLYDELWEKIEEAREFAIANNIQMPLPEKIGFKENKFRKKSFEKWRLNVYK